MSVSLVTYPVVSEDGIIKNLFPGFSDVELEFKREDIQIKTITNGAGNKILVTCDGAILLIPPNIQIGEYVYIYSEGDTYTYDLVAKVTTIGLSGSDTTLLLDADWIENTSAGYCNYKQNWYLESKLVNEDNNTILEYPKVLQNDGNPDGQVFVNVSQMVDFLSNEILTTSGQQQNNRNKCQVMYREVWRDDDTAVFTLIDENPIAIVYAADEIDNEKIINKMEYPRLYKGYPFILSSARQGITSFQLN